MRMLDAWTEIEKEVWYLQKLQGYIRCSNGGLITWSAHKNDRKLMT
jgi:hypothetical protein